MSQLYATYKHVARFGLVPEVKDSNWIWKQIVKAKFSDPNPTLEGVGQQLRYVYIQV